ncbi:MAG: peptidylprolyl isomerase [Chromatiales bacterium]|nr:peptidylprolyl isomerase [Chromatiales bacterium]
MIISLLSILLITACQPQEETAMSENADGAEITGLQITDVLDGDGLTAEAGQEVVVHYTGWLYDPDQPENKGEKFDSSVDRGDPFSFPLGAGRVIRGWDEGFAGMQIGGKRILVIPPDMGYGDRSVGGVIPPNATLMFEVELLDIK